MNYWHCVLLLCSWMTILTMSGRPLARLLPLHARRTALFHLSPALGLCLHVLIATCSGWLFGTRPALAMSSSALVIIIALWLERDWKQLVRHLAWVNVASAVISVGLLLTIYLYEGYNVYNDTFTYLVHAQWLQSHPFREPVDLTILNPAYTQVALYQIAGLRMGASFFLGWVQAASPFTWSIYVYPATIALALTTGALAIGGLASSVLPSRQKMLPFIWSLATGTSVSGLTYGCFTGFLPQLFGLSICTLLLSLLICLRPSPPTSSWREVLPLALTFSALGFAYSELLPFAAITLTGWFGVSLFLTQDRASWLAAAARFAGWAVLLLNIECIRIARAIILQSKTVVGWAVPWSEGEFASLALGMRSGPGDGNWWILHSGSAVVLAFAVLLALAFFVVWQCGRHRRRWSRWSGPLIFVLLCVTAFAVFRYRVTSPWPVGTGQTWNQFKLSNWISPALLALSGTGLLWLGRRKAIAPLVGLAMLLWLGLNLRAHIQLASVRIAEPQRLTGKIRAPFSVYTDIRKDALEAQPPGTIFLDLGGADQKSRQIAAYFLHDLPIAADWTGDDYISPTLPPGWETLSPTNSSWLVRRRESSGNNAAEHGALVFTRAPEFLVTKQNIAGGHGVESDASGWWVWSHDQLKVQLKIHGELPAEVSIKFTCIATAQPRQLSVVCRSTARELFTETIVFPEGWQAYTSAPFRVTDPDVYVEISSSSTPVPIGPPDPRLAAFLAKNVRLEFVRNDP